MTQEFQTKHLQDNFQTRRTLVHTQWRCSWRWWLCGFSFLSLLQDWLKVS